jgi:uncharacterized protein YyaL (SSP411 family)
MNRLADEISPYLRQHRDNPVDWYPWGPEAFAAAAERDVPVLISVGYSSCHWCHVMAHESFEDAEAATAMNDRFVNIKVDREERPDVDAIYMDAVQAMTGRGGWPMTVFATPDGKPFYGGTYYPKSQFLQLLAAIDDAWRTKRDELGKNVEALVKAVKQTESLAADAELPNYAPINAALKALANNYDKQWGGFGPAPKFPATAQLEVLMRGNAHAPSDALRLVVTNTLDAMASGGMYDHLGGGFARYSVDERWLVPHFEKMLYDQALLLRAYLHGHQVFGEQRWVAVIAETVEYLCRDLRHPDGGFYSAEDADSPDADGHSVEGAFYTWTPGEVGDVLGGEAGARVCEWYGISDAGNFEGRSIPNRLHARGQFDRPEDIEQARRALFAARASRPRPGLDDKVVTEWNALTISALAEAGAVLGRREWIDTARRTADFLLDELRTRDGRWFRSWHADGAPRARHGAVAADLAALVEAFCQLAAATGEARWIEEAQAVADTLLDRYWDVAEGGLFTVPDHGPADGTPLIARQKDLLDNATPSANSTAAGGLYRLAALTGELRYANQADRILQLIGPLAAKAPTAFGYALAAIDMRRTGITEIVVPGGEPEFLSVARETWRPNSVLAWGEPFPSPLWHDRRPGVAYVCQHAACQLPSATPDDLREQLA